MKTENPNDDEFPSLSIHALFDESIDGNEPLPLATGIEILQAADVIMTVGVMSRIDVILFGKEQVIRACNPHCTDVFMLVRIAIDDAAELEQLCNLVEIAKGYCDILLSK